MLNKYITNNSLLPFFLAWELHLTQSNYNLCFSYPFTDSKNIELLITALQKLINLKPYLRQTFALENNQVFATVHDQLPAKINFFTSSLAEFSQLEQDLIHARHDITKKSAIKLNIIKFNDSNNCIALFNIHHIIMDGYSLDHFISELNLLLANQTIKQESTRDYLRKIAQQLPLEEENTSSQEISDYLEEVNDLNEKIDHLRANNNHNINHYTAKLPNAITQSLTLFSQQHNISLFNLLLVAWSIFTAKILNQNCALVNYPVNIRTDKTLEGCFLNVVTLPIKLTTLDTYSSLIQSWQDKLALIKQSVKINLTDKLNIGAIASFANSNLAQPLKLIIDNKFYDAKTYPQIANSFLNAKYREYEGKIFFTYDILADIFPEYFTSTLLPRFFNFLNKLLLNPTTTVISLDLTFAEEKKRLLYDFNKTEAFYPQDKTLVTLFEDQVNKTPDNIAIVYENIKLTYAELNEQANQLAHYLRNQYQIKPDHLIALLLDRNEYMLISILGALKSGGAYVPLEPNYPPERINYILKDIKTKVILTNEAHKDKLNHFQNNFLNLEDNKTILVDSKRMQAKLVTQITTNPTIKITSSNLAYVIYTSGTTGNPKGVMIEHKGVINTLFSIYTIYKTEKNKIENPLKITAFTNYVFDVSVAEFFVALLKGHELHLLSNELRQNVILIGKYINKYQINYIYLPPVLLASLPRESYPSLRGIVYAGEPCNKETGFYWSRKYKLFNFYGPTETSIYATGLELKSGEVNLIGKPTINTFAYVLNSDMNILPIGIIGELYLSGVGLARGYLNQAQLTTQQFISNPHQRAKYKFQQKNKLLYKTGDLVRWLPDGNLEYIGRKDFQVKIRGYRIELGEIESTIANHPKIKQAIVLAKNNNQENSDHYFTNNKYLVVYYVASTKIDEAELQNFLAKQLPEYMLPNLFIHLNEFPMNINGKIDRKAFPNPKFINTINYVKPKNKKERLVCQAFSRVLKLKKVGVHDDFFKLGGSSIKAITLVTNLQANFNINVTDIFNLKTPQQIAKQIPLVKNNLKQYLTQIKLNYQPKLIKSIVNKPLQFKIDQYFSSINKLATIGFQKKHITNVLLTGATGFLGCNLLNQLLTLTNYNVFLLIRASSSEEAFTRVNKKFQFYFDKRLDYLLNKRIFVFPTNNIGESNLGLNKIDYQILVTQIDSIIHSAALTKHYGEYETLYSANVKTTINLLELCKQTYLKDFHYISTISVLDQGYIPNHDHYIFTEDDWSNDLEGQTNIYIKTKSLGETLVNNYRKQGINSNIYRVGNLAFIANNYRTQENIEDNAFFSRIKCILNLKVIAQTLHNEEISPVDLTSEAIIKLFDKQLLNNTFHVFNPNPCNLAEIFSKNPSWGVHIVSLTQFIDIIIKYLDNPNQQKIIERFLLHQGWLNAWNIQSTKIRILQDRTQFILKQLGFVWPLITNEIFHQYLKKELKHEQESQDFKISRNYSFNPTYSNCLVRHQQHSVGH